MRFPMYVMMSYKNNNGVIFSPNRIIVFNSSCVTSEAPPPIAHWMEPGKASVFILFYIMHKILTFHCVQRCCSELNSQHDFTLRFSSSNAWTWSAMHRTKCLPNTRQWHQIVLHFSSYLPTYSQVTCFSSLNLTAHAPVPGSDLGPGLRTGSWPHHPLHGAHPPPRLSWGCVPPDGSGEGGLQASHCQH